MNWIHDFQLFLFDFDGLLVDTERVHFAAYVKMLSRRGHQLEWTFTHYCTLAHLHHTAIREALYREFPDLDPNWELLYAEKRGAYMDLIASGKIQLMPGVEPLLKELQKANIRRCVVTHSPLEQIQTIRSQLPILDTIPQWITREDYENPKPNPECYLKAIACFSQPGDRIIGFEDSLRGFKALQQTPARPVLICSSQHPLLYSMGDVLHFESFEKLVL